LRVAWPGLALLLVACSHPPAPQPGAPAAALPDDAGTTSIAMRDVEVPVGAAKVRIRSLCGTISGTDGSPDIVHPKSYVIHVDGAEVALDDAALTEVLARAATSGAAIHDPEVTVTPGRMRVAGHVNKPFPTHVVLEGPITVSPQGLLVLSPDRVKADGLSATGPLRTLNLTLQDVVGDYAGRGVTISDNTVIIDALVDLPPPAIDAKVVGARLEQGGLVLLLAHDATSTPKAPPDVPVEDATDQPGKNWVMYEGGLMRIGKLTQHGADLRVYDKDPGDAFDVSADRFQEQLAAGNVKVRADGGLRVWVPDWNEVPGH
jgi:hypothetical protein